MNLGGGGNTSGGFTFGNLNIDPTKWR
jgi:hypothetical protein